MLVLAERYYVSRYTQEQLPVPPFLAEREARKEEARELRKVLSLTTVADPLTLEGERAQRLREWYAKTLCEKHEAVPAEAMCLVGDRCRAVAISFSCDSSLVPEGWRKISRWRSRPFSKT